MFASFMINTWLVATIVAVVAGLVGFFVVIRGAAFAAHAFTDNVLISTPACVLFAFATAVFARGRHERAGPSALPGAGEVA